MEMPGNQTQLHGSKGPSIKYVRTEGEGGSKNSENMRTIVLIGCVKCVQEGGGGQKSRKIYVRTLWMLPYKKRSDFHGVAPEVPRAAV